VIPSRFGDLDETFYRLAFQLCLVSFPDVTQLAFKGTSAGSIQLLPVCERTRSENVILTDVLPQYKPQLVVQTCTRSDPCHEILLLG